MHASRASGILALGRVMLARYQMKRGAPRSALPRGHRIDTRKHTSHVLRPTAKLVDAFLGKPGASWSRFERDYLALVEKRFAADRTPFDELAALARTSDVYLGCSCPTAKNPDVEHCHTYLALQFMRDHYPDLDVVFPA